MGNCQPHENGHTQPEGKLGELAGPGKERPIAGQERPVDGQDDERPNQGHRINHQGAVGNRRKRVGAGNEGESAGNQDRGPERDVFALLPVGALLESLGARSRQPKENVFDGMEHEEKD